MSIGNVYGMFADSQQTFHDRWNDRFRTIITTLVNNIVFTPNLHYTSSLAMIVRKLFETIVTCFLERQLPLIATIVTNYSFVISLECYLPRNGNYHYPVMSINLKGKDNGIYTFWQCSL